MHILGNMIFLWVFGDNIEEALGRGALPGVLSPVRHRRRARLRWQRTHSKVPLIGASGAIAGVVMRLCDVAPLRQGHGADLRLHPDAASAPIGWSASCRSCSSAISSACGKSEVAYWCHVGGHAAGAVLFSVMRPAGVHAVRVHRGRARRRRDRPAPTACRWTGPPEAVGRTIERTLTLRRARQ